MGSGPVTVSETLTVCELVLPPEPAIVIVPVKGVVLGVRPDGLIETVTVPGVVPLAGLTVSQPLLEALAVKPSAVPELETEMVCEAGGLSPVRYANDIVLGLTVNVAGACTTMVTATVCGDPPVGVNVIVP